MTIEERQEAAKWFQNRASHTSMPGAKMMFERAAEALSEGMQPHWIPCSERLPDYGEVVLWCNKHGSVFASAITYQSVDYFSVGKHGGNRTIIAWMPLPKPYGGEDE